MLFIYGVSFLVVVFFFNINNYSVELEILRVYFSWQQVKFPFCEFFW